MVYQNGESSKRWVHIWAETLDEILAQATERLGLPRHAKLIFDENRQRVTSFETLERDSLLCITTGDTLKGRREYEYCFEQFIPDFKRGGGPIKRFD